MPTTVTYDYQGHYRYGPTVTTPDDAAVTIRDGTRQRAQKGSTVTGSLQKR